MNCPDDGGNLIELQVKSFYGWQVTIDQCPVCHGLWFDSMELFPIDSREAVRVDILKKPLPVSDSDEKPCPRCSQPLRDFLDPNFPAQFNVHICRNCQGMWLYKGTFTEYKQYQAQKRSELSRKLAAREAEQLAAAENITPVEKFSKFLMTPYYGSSGSVDAQRIAGTAMSILQLLLRILLR